jgi:TonB family protein
MPRAAAQAWTATKTIVTRISGDVRISGTSDFADREKGIGTILPNSFVLETGPSSGDFAQFQNSKIKVRVWSGSLIEMNLHEQRVFLKNGKAVIRVNVDGAKAFQIRSNNLVSYIRHSCSIRVQTCEPRENKPGFDKISVIEGSPIEVTNLSNGAAQIFPPPHLEISISNLANPNLFMDKSLTTPETTAPAASPRLPDACIPRRPALAEAMLKFRKGAQENQKSFSPEELSGIPKPVRPISMRSPAPVNIVPNVSPQPQLGKPMVKPKLSELETDYTQYRSDMHRRITRTWKPPSSKGENWTSMKTVVNVSVNQQGAISDLQLCESSKDRDFDAAALTSLQAASPFRPTPFGTGLYSGFKVTFSLSP